MPRDHLIDEWDRLRIIDFRGRNPPEGYRRLTFMMLDRDVFAVSPSTMYRLLLAAGLTERWSRRPSKKGTGFGQLEKPHQHWRIDVS